MKWAGKLSLLFFIQFFSNPEKGCFFLFNYSTLFTNKNIPLRKGASPPTGVDYLTFTDLLSYILFS